MTLSANAVALAILSFLGLPLLPAVAAFRGAFGAAAAAVFRGARGAFVAAALVRRVVFAVVVMLVEPFLRLL